MNRCSYGRGGISPERGTCTEPPLTGSMFCRRHLAEAMARVEALAPSKRQKPLRWTATYMARSRE